METETETVELSDKRKVVMRELNGFDMMIAGQLAKGDMSQMTAIATTFSIVEIDGQKFIRPTNLVAVQAFMRTVKVKDVGRLSAAFGRLNGDDEPGEAEAGETSI